MAAAPLRLRPLRPEDTPQLEAVYHDAVISQAPTYYSPEQVAVWAGHGLRPDGIRPALVRGQGLVSCDPVDDAVIEAFGLLDPPDRLALLYCRGRSSRQGRATALLRALQRQAHLQGQHRLRTEASQLSRPLLEREGWQVEAEETAFYGAVAFQRWRMVKPLP
jgi:putative acetyltransferase